MDVALGLIQRFPGCDAAGQVGHVGRPIVFCALEYHGVSQTHCFASSPAAFRTDFKVPTGTSSPEWPGTVTTFGFVACLKCRWLPVVRTCRQPSDSICRIRSRTFPRFGYVRAWKGANHDVAGLQRSS